MKYSDLFDKMIMNFERNRPSNKIIEFFIEGPPLILKQSFSHIDRLALYLTVLFLTPPPPPLYFLIQTPPPNPSLLYI